MPAVYHFIYAVIGIYFAGLNYAGIKAQNTTKITLGGIRINSSP